MRRPLLIAVSTLVLLAPVFAQDDHTIVGSIRGEVVTTLRILPKEGHRAASLSLPADRCCAIRMAPSIYSQAGIYSFSDCR